MNTVATKLHKTLRTREQIHYFFGGIWQTPTCKSGSS